MRVAAWIAILFSATSVLTAVAQQDDETMPGETIENAVEPVRRYAVELIVFVYSESVSAGTEIWLPDEADYDHRLGTNADDLSVGYRNEFSDRDNALTEIEAPAAARRFMNLDLSLFAPGDYSMTKIYEKLVELDAYQPVFRAGWSQITFDKSVTAPVELRRLANPPSWLEGSLTLYRGRYLHLVVDVTMDAERQDAMPAQGPGQPAATFGDARVQNEVERFDEFGRPMAPIRYRIFEDRIMKNGDIRYFDHPKFGVIAKITREEDAEDEAIDDTGDLLPGSLVSP